MICVNPVVAVLSMAGKLSKAGVSVERELVQRVDNSARVGLDLHTAADRYSNAGPIQSLTQCIPDFAPLMQCRIARTYMKICPTLLVFQLFRRRVESASFTRGTQTDCHRFRSAL